MLVDKTTFFAEFARKKGVYERIALVLVNQHRHVALAERLTKIPAQNCNVLLGLQ